MSENNRRNIFRKKFGIFLLCNVLLAGYAGCGRNYATGEKTKTLVDDAQEKSETEIVTESMENTENDQKTDTEIMLKNEELLSKDAKADGQSEIETPEEKTIRLRTEAIHPPLVSADKVTDLHIEIHKKQHALQLWNDGELIAEYPVGLAKNPVGAKEKEGDNKNPEGSYYICNKNSRSKYHLALGISYPNVQDAYRGYEAGLISEAEKDSLIYANEHEKKPDWYTALGGEIMIHGQKGEKGSESDWTRGCFAVDNEIMDLIWDYVKVGTPVIITAD